MTEKNEINIYYQNVRSIKSKNNSIYLDTLIHNFNIYALTETWLNESRNSGEYFNLTSFKIYRADRIDSNKKTGGGCLLAIDQSISSKEIYFPLKISTCNNKIDITGATIKINNVSISLLIIYIPPDCDSNVYTKFFTDLTQYMVTQNTEHIILGNFNIPKLKSLDQNELYSKKRIALLEFSKYFKLMQKNCILNNKNYLLDLVLTSLHGSVVHAED